VGTIKVNGGDCHLSYSLSREASYVLCKGLRVVYIALRIRVRTNEEKIKSLYPERLVPSVLPSEVEVSRGK
jgi:hypothetical protein